MSPEVAQTELFQRKCQGDQEAREQLILSNLVLAKSLARRFVYSGEPLEDLIQIATVGLIDAVDRFDSNRGIQFSTFAHRTILGVLRNYLRDRGQVIRVAGYMQERLQKIGKAEEVLTKQFSRPPTVSEIADYLEFTIEQVIDAISIRERQPRSLEGLDEGFMGGNDPEIERVEERYLVEQILDALRQLDERSRTVITLIFLEGKTAKEVATLWGCSQTNVSRLKRKAITKIRRLVNR